ncbi:hypothetical protein KI387_017941, partial [Taxus chinensis]
MVISPYENGQENLQLLENFGAMTLHDVDATKMCKHEILRERLFDRIVFNFPRAGFHRNEKEAAVIKKHRDLVKMFFKNARNMLSRTGEIHVTHKVEEPYGQWKVVEEAEKCGLLLKESVEFNKDFTTAYFAYAQNLSFCGSSINDEMRSDTRESMTAPIMLPNNSLELETERKNREAAETAKADMESSFNHLKTVADKAIKERDEFERKINEVIHQRDEAQREKENITIQLAEALRLKKNAIEQRTVSILELTFEREARKAAETAKENMDDLHNHYKRLVFNLHGDHALCQIEEAYSEKEKIAKQLDEALRLKEEVTKEKEKILREQIDLANQKDEIYRDKKKIAEGLDEALRLKEEAIKEREKILRDQNDLSNHKNEVYWEKGKIAAKLDEVLRLKEEVSKEMERIQMAKEEIAKWEEEVSRLKEEANKQGKRFDSGLLWGTVEIIFGLIRRL